MTMMMQSFSLALWVKCNCSLFSVVAF